MKVLTQGAAHDEILLSDRRGGRLFSRRVRSRKPSRDDRRLECATLVARGKGAEQSAPFCVSAQIPAALALRQRVRQERQRLFESFAQSERRIDEVDA